MRPSSSLVFACAAVLAALPIAGQAHFKLLEPASALVENERGDPQKAAPCGGDAKDKGTPSGAITKAIGGSRLKIKVLETIYHPGHYRVALSATGPLALPPDPQTMEKFTERGTYSVWGVIQSPPQAPVIADGLFPHYTRPASPQTYEAEVQLPNVTCARCTLQVIQFMADHIYNVPGGYSYHHCADIQITADPAKPIDKAWQTTSTVQ